ncbi:MAG: STAS domain-containing protein [Microcystaceae cyanobacterium]
MTKSPFKILQPSGYITAANVSEFQELLTQTVNTHPDQDYLIDMESVEFLDSAGLMALVSSFRLAQSQGKRINICSLAPSVKIIFELTQLDKVMPIYDHRNCFLATVQPSMAA